MAPHEEPSEQLKYQTWVLRVSIHCEGCKKKVKRVLHSVPGVYETDFDVRQHKVTVTANVNVDPDVLVRKLVKSNKHAELWPEMKPINPNPNTNDAGNAKSKKKASAKPNEASESPEPAKDISSNDTTVAANNNAAAAKSGDAPKVVSCETAKNSGKEVSKSDGADSASSSPSSEKVAVNPAVAAQSGGETSAGNSTANPASGSGGKKKKKKKKAKKPNAPAGNSGAVSGGEADSEEEDGDSPPPASQPQRDSPPPALHPAAASLPHQPAYHFPMYAPQPVYAVSYSTAHPSTSYGSTYYAPAIPQSYVYAGHPPAEDYYGPMEPASTPQGSYDFFSEENANACKVM